ncbi:MAG: hypothetical protein M3441_04265 [Chloroflexota bacterium]|nr:hypothetical protein [Chloroflexota bacterium]
MPKTVNSSVDAFALSERGALDEVHTALIAYLRAARQMQHARPELKVDELNRSSISGRAER